MIYVVIGAILLLLVIVLLKGEDSPKPKSDEQILNDLRAKQSEADTGDLESVLKKLHPEDFKEDPPEKEPTIEELDEKIADIKKQMRNVINDCITVETPPMTECTMMFDLKGLYYRTEDEQKRADELERGDKLKLVPEPDNIKDKFAIKVLTEDNVHIGYVPSDFCQKLSRNLQFVEECYVYNVGFYDSPFFNVGLKVVGKSEFYWEKYFMAKETFYEYKEKYDELKVNLYAIHQENKDEYLKIWKDLYDKHPGDDYIEFKYIGALYDHKDYELVIEMAEKFRDRMKLYDFPHLRHWIEYAPQELERKKSLEEYEKANAIYDEACESYKNKQYEEALNKFLQCVSTPVHKQALPKNICNCYIKLDMIPYLIQFIKSIQDEEWLSETTRNTLQKHLDKYDV